MFDVGSGELLLIIVAIIVLFGPQKLPEIAQMVGKGMKKFRAAQDEFKGQLDNLKDEINIAANSENVKPSQRPTLRKSRPASENNEDFAAAADSDDFHNSLSSRVPGARSDFASGKAPRAAENESQPANHKGGKERPFKTETDSYPDYDPVI